MNALPLILFFLDLRQLPAPRHLRRQLDAVLTAILMVCVVVIIVASARTWIRAMRGEAIAFVPAAAGPDPRHIPGSGCC